MLKTIGPTVSVFLLVVAMAGVFASVARAAVPQPPPAGQSEFVPVDELPPLEQMPAAPLLVAAYAVAWLVLLLYLWSIWRRLGAVERELADVARRIDAGARRS